MSRGLSAYIAALFAFGLCMVRPGFVSLVILLGVAAVVVVELRETEK